MRPRLQWHCCSRIRPPGRYRAPAHILYALEVYSSFDTPRTSPGILNPRSYFRRSRIQNTPMWPFWFLAAFALCAWLTPFVLVRFSGWQPARLSDVPADELARYPSLSVIVPACDEEATIGPAM